MADLSKDAERPALSPEGMLRALVVASPGSGVDWEGRARLVVVGNDLAASQGAVPMPEQAYQTTAAAVVAEFSTFLVLAGPRGCHAFFLDSNLTTVQVRRFDSLEALATVETFTAQAPVLPVWEINGGTLSTLIVGTIAGGTSGVGLTEVGLLNTFIAQGRGGFWLRPGALTLFSNGAANSAITGGLLLREPVAP